MKKNFRQIVRCIICLSVFCITAAEVSAQSPGGVSTNLEMWTRADIGVSGTTANVTGWTDQSSSGRSWTKANGALNPLNTAQFNYNPAVQFTVNNWFYTPQFMNAATAGEVFSVQLSNLNNGVATLHYPFELGGNFANANQSTYTWTNSDHYTYFGSSIRRNFTYPATVNVRNPNMLNIWSAANDWAAGMNGQVVLTSNVNTVNFVSQTGTTPPRYYVGAGHAAIFNGDVAEVIAFSRKLGAAERQQVQSYLAVKYGLTLSNSGGGTNGDYVTSTGTNIWTASTGSAYHNNVIGIGRDDNSVLTQKQSSQITDATRIYINTLAATNQTNAGTFASNGQFVMIGDNNASLTTNFANLEYPSGLGIGRRFDREWKITNTGFTGTFSLSILPSTNNYIASQIVVLIDDDGDFSNATAITPTVTITGGRIELTGISTAMVPSTTTKYLALAVKPAVSGASPGGVADNMQLWVKANAGVAVTGANVTQWTNQSGAAMTTEASIAASADVTLGSADFNYNPSLTFSGTSSQRLTGTFAAATSNPGLMFAVVKKSVSPDVALANPYSVLGAGNATAQGIAYNAGTFGVDNSGTLCGTTASAINIPGIVRVDYNTALSTSGANTAFNGLLSTGAACGTQTVSAASANFEIGGRTAGPVLTRIFAGQIAELIHFDLNSLSDGTGDINRVESYLAVKYGLTLSNSGGGTNGNYTTSTGTTIWSASTGSAYHNNVIGVGRDDKSGLTQKQSKQTDDAARIYIGTLVASNAANAGSFATDGQFVMMGNNNATATTNSANTEFPSGLGIAYRFDREWKITNTNFTGTFSLSISPSSGTFNANTLRVLVDDDGDFSNATIITPTITIVSSRIILTGISNAMIASGATKYITIAVLSTPGGLTDIMKLWTKADAGVIVSGANVTQWTNQWGTAIPDANIVLDPDNFNYNPTLIFSGASGKVLAGTFATIATSTPVVLFAVAKKAASPINSFGGPYAMGPAVGYGISQNNTGTYGIQSGAGTLCTTGANFTNIPAIVRVDYVLANSTQNTQLVANNSNTTPACATVALAAPDGTFQIGGNTFGGATRVFAGEIAEMIHYELTSITGAGTSIKKIESYLALKYGITLGTSAGGTGDYTSSAGTTTWASTGIAYHNGVIGIARDDASGLLQKQSHQTDDATRIYLSTLVSSNQSNTGSFSSDAQFVIMGHNNGALSNTGSTEYPAGINGRMTREWRITNTAFTGTFSLDITPTATCANTGLRLLVDDDGDFSNGGTAIYSSADGISFTNAGGVITIGGISTAIIPANSTRYITLATAAIPTPSQVICSGTMPANISLSGYTGTVSKWQYSTDNFAADINDISSSAATTLTSSQMGTLTAARWYRAVITDFLCATVNSYVATVTTDPVSVGGTPTSAQTICSGTSPANLVLGGNTGNVTKWQYSVNADFSAATDILVASATLTSAQIGNLAQTTYFRGIVKSGVCAIANSAAVTVTVDPVSVGGTPTAAQTICSGTSPSSLLLGGHTGSVTKWQYSVNADFSGAIDIPVASATLTGAQIGNLTQTTYFRAIVQNGVCTIVNSAAVTVTVDPVSAGGTPTAAQTICAGTSPTNLTLSGHTGTVNKWQYSVNADFSAATDIASSNAAVVTSALIGNLTQTTYFRAIVQSGVCAVATSATVTVTVNAVSAGGTPNAAQTICTGTSPTDLTLGGHTGNVNKWQYSVNADFSTPTDILVASATLTSAQIGNLTQTTYFRAIVQSGVCAVATSATVTVTVNAVSVGGTPDVAQTICSGTSPVDLTLSGQTGTVTKWQYSVNADFSGATDIASSNAVVLTGAQIGNLTQTTYFRAVVQNGVCAAVNSGAVTVTVNAISAGGAVTAAQTICNGTSPADLTLSGQTGTVTKWQYANAADFSGAADIASTSTTLSAAVMGNLTQTRYYRAVIQNGVCAAVNSAVLAITVLPAAVGGTPTTLTQTICSGTAPADIVLNGQTGNVIKWQYSSSSNFSSDINDISSSASATLSSAQIGTLTSSRYFRAVVQVSNCAATANSTIAAVVINALPTITINPASAEVTSGQTVVLTASGASTYVWGPATGLSATTGASVNANPTATVIYTVTGTDANSCQGIKTIEVKVNNQLYSGTIGSNQTICSGTIPASLSSTAVANGGTGTITYQWESSTDNLSFSSIAGANAAGFTPTGALTQTTYYRRGASTTNDGMQYTGSITVTVQQSAGGTVTGSATVCSGTNATVLNVTGYTGAITKWQSSTLSDFSSGVTDIAVTTANLNLTNLTSAASTTIYYRAVVQMGSCAVSNSNAGSVTVNQLPNVTVTPTAAAITRGQSVTLTASGAGSYIWTPSTGLSATNTASVIASPTNTAQATVYTVTGTNGNSCSNAASVTITVNPALTAGNIAADQTICSGTAPASFTSTTDAAGGTGARNYQWQSSVDNVSFTNIAGANAAVYAPGVLTQTTYYRRGVSTSNDAVQYTNSVQVTVQKTTGGTLNGSATVVSGTNSTLLQLTGATGSVVKWQSSQSGTFTDAVDISNTGTSYSANNLTGTTHYRVVLQQGSCAEATSTVATIIVNPPVVISFAVFTTLDPGTIATDQTICTGTAPAAFTSTAAATGTALTITYQWQESTDNQNFTDIPSATAETYTAGILTQTTYYRRGAYTVDDAIAYTASVTVTVNQSVGGNINGSATVCAGNNTATLSLAGHKGNVIRWESSTVADFSSGVTIIANTTTGLSISNLATTTYYRAVVQGSPCATVISATASVTVIDAPAVSVSPTSIVVTPGKTTTLTVSGNADSYLWTPSTALSATTGTTVDASPSSSITYSVTGTRTVGGCTNTATVNVTVVTNLVPGSISADQLVCSGTAPAAFTSVSATGGSGAIQYQWQQSLDNISFSNIPGATTEIYNAPALTQTTYYRRKAYTTNDADEFTNSLKVDVLSTIGGTVSGSATVCSGTNNPIFNLTGQTGNVIKWQSSAVADFSSGVTDISNTSTSLNLQNLIGTGTRYYRAVVQSGTCAVSYSAPASIIFNQSPAITINPPSATITSGSSVVLTASGADSYLWTPSTALSSTNTAIVTAIPNSTIVYTVTGMKAGCSATASITLTVNEPLNAGSITGAQSVCTGAAVATLSSVTDAKGGTGARNYQWQGSTDNSSFTDIPGANAAVYNPGTLTQTMYYRRAVSTATDGVRYTLPVKITVAPPVAKPVITASGPLKLSPNGTVMLASTPALVYQWSNGSTGQTILVTTTTVGIYKVKTKDAIGCSSEESDAVTVIPPPPFVIDSAYISGINNPPNTGVQVTVTPGGVLRYYLQTGGAAVPVPVLPAVPGVYTYYVSQVFNGIESDPVPYKVTILKLLAVADHQKLLSGAPDVQADGSVLIRFTFLMANKNSARIDSVKLLDDLSAVFPATAQYSVDKVTATGNLLVNTAYNGSTVSNMLLPGSWIAAGATDTVKLTVKLFSELSGTLENKSTMQGKSQYGLISIVSNDPIRSNGDLVRSPTPFVLPETALDIPSGFSPNHDGVNDKFVIRHPGNMSINLKVFNRWGNIIYGSSDYKDDWDGRGTQGNIIGADLPDGTYYYVIIATNKTTGKISRQTGDVTIKRQ
jgi:gliding motility-associated-like protein